MPQRKGKMIEKILGFVIGVLVLFWFLFIQGCNSVKIEERVVYEDGSPVVGCKVHQYTSEGYNGYTKTDNSGRWSLTVPSNTVMYLCVENPLSGNEMSCFEGVLLTPAIESGSHNMVKM